MSVSPWSAVFRRLRAMKKHAAAWAAAATAVGDGDGSAAGAYTRPLLSST